MSIRGSVAWLAVVAVMLGGCTTPPAGPATIAVVLPSEDGRFGDVATVLRERFEDAGYRVEVHSTDGDIPAQVTTVGELLADDPAGLVVWPIDATSLTPVLDDAPASVQVVSLGELVRDTAAVDGYVAFDAAAGGYLQATALVRALFGAGPGATPEAAGPFTIELFAGSPEDDRTEPAFAAAMSVLQPYLDDGSLVVGSGETALADVTTLRANEQAAQERMAGLLAGSSPDSIPDAVLAPSDRIARGVTAALLDAGAVPGTGFPIVTGRGSELRSLVALLDGRQYATLLEDPRALAAEAAARLLDLLAADPGILPHPSAVAPGASVDNGARLVPASLVEPVEVLAGDIDELVIATGYWSRERLDEAIDEYGVTPVVPEPTATPGS